MAVKASRYLTHIRRLRDPEELVGRLMDRARHLGPKFGPVLLQLPPTCGPTRPPSTGPCGRSCWTWVAEVEPRHDSWWTDEVQADLPAATGRPLPG